MVYKGSYRQQLVMDDSTYLLLFRSWFEYLISLNVEYGSPKYPVKECKHIKKFILYNLEQHDKAITYYDKYLAINPDYDEADKHKDLAIEKLQDTG